LKAKDIYKSPTFVVACITAIGAALRLYGLGSRALWFDEAIIYGISSAGSLSRILDENAALNSAPPLFPALLRLVLWVGDSEGMLRLIPCLAGIAALPAIYFLSRHFAGRTAGYLSALVVGLASTQIEYSQQVREYSLAFLLASVQLAFFVRAMHRPTWKNFALMTGAMILGIFLQYGLALLALALNIAFLVEMYRPLTHRGRLVVKWTAAQLLVVLAALIVYSVSLRQQWVLGFAGSGGYLEGSYGEGTARSFLRVAVLNTIDLLRFAFPGPYLFYFLTGALAVGLVAGVRKAREPAGNRALSMMIVPLLVTSAAASLRLYPYAGIRQDMFLLPMIYVFVGQGLSLLLQVIRKRWLLPAVWLLVVAAAVPPIEGYVRSPGIEDIRPVLSALADSFREGDKIYVYYGARPAFTYYYRKHQEAWVFGTTDRGHPGKDVLEVKGLLTSTQRVWLVFSHCSTNECSRIPDHLAKTNAMDLVATGQRSWLYLAH
jgi:uncharacterized membrane protein